MRNATDLLLSLERYCCTVPIFSTGRRKRPVVLRTAFSFLVYGAARLRLLTLLRTTIARRFRLLLRLTKLQILRVSAALTVLVSTVLTVSSCNKRTDGPVTTALSLKRRSCNDGSHSDFYRIMLIFY